jgi:hypothetical protein
MNARLSNNTSNRSERGLAAIFAVPFVLALLILFGLLSALVGEEGVWLWLSWTALAIPIGIIVLMSFGSRWSKGFMVKHLGEKPYMR